MDLDDELTADQANDHGPGLPQVLSGKRRPGASPRRPGPRVRPRRPAPEPLPVNVYPNVAAWVAGFLAPAFAHHWGRYGSGDWRWCSRWWLHVEAVIRLEALWTAWEHLRLDPTTGRSTWLVNHLAPNLAALTDPEGTFSRCKPGEHEAPEPLVLETPPPGMF